jgi:hypothetical protein
MDLAPGPKSMPGACKASPTDAFRSMTVADINAIPILNEWRFRRAFGASF